MESVKSYNCVIRDIIGRDNDTKTSNSTEMLKLCTMSSLLLVIFLASVSGNLLVFVVFYKRALLTISNRFIMNLSICNLINTLIVMPFMFAAIISGDWIFGDVWCKTTGFLMNTIFAASTLTLVAISLDRYCAVVTPLHYKMRITSRRSVYMIVTVWTLAILASLPPLFGWNHYQYHRDKRTCTVFWASHGLKDRYYTLFLVSLSFILPLGIIVWAYIVIFKAAQNNSERTRRNSVVPTNQLDDMSQIPLNKGRRRSSSAPILVRRLSSSSRTNSLLWQKDEWKTAVTSLIVVSTFIICWLPYFIVIILESLLNSPEDIHPIIETMSILLAMSSCSCNPVVYVFRSKVARQELKVVLRLQSREDAHVSNVSRRGSTCTFVRDGIPRQSSTESDNYPFQEKPLHMSSTATTLTSLIHVPSSTSMRA